MLKILYRSRFSCSLSTGTQTISTSITKIAWFFSLPWSPKIFGSTVKWKKAWIPLSSESQKNAICFLHEHELLFLLCMHMIPTKPESGELAVQPIACKLYLWWWQKDYTPCKCLGITCASSHWIKHICPEQDLLAAYGYYSITCWKYWQQKEGREQDRRFIRWVSFITSSRFVPGLYEKAVVLRK